MSSSALTCAIEKAELPVKQHRYFQAAKALVCTEVHYRWYVHQNNNMKQTSPTPLLSAALGSAPLLINISATLCAPWGWLGLVNISAKSIFDKIKKECAREWMRRVGRITLETAIISGVTPELLAMSTTASLASKRSCIALSQRAWFSCCGSYWWYGSGGVRNSCAKGDNGWMQAR